MDKFSYDIIVLGAGSTGENVADRAVRGGLTAAIIESDLVGGDCSYWACMPSKALLRPGLALEDARSVLGAREAVTGKLNAPAAFKRRDNFVSNWNDSGQVEWLRHANVDLLRGHGRLVGERRVSVTDKDGLTTNLTARHAVAVCTGSQPTIPDIPGLDEANPWTSREATSAKTIPRRLAILGGGVVACEMAAAWKQLGTEEITIIERGERLIPKCESFAGEFLRTAFVQQGITVLTDTTVRRVDRQNDGVARLAFTSGQTLFAEKILVATGRQPRTKELGLETIGLKPGGWLEVDDSLRVREVTAGWLYAAGDVNHRALLTHMGKYQGRVCGDVIAARAKGNADVSALEPWTRYAATADNCAIPQVIFTNPEVAAVGLTETEAKTRGLNARAVDYDIGRVAGAALYADDYKGKAPASLLKELGVVLPVPPKPLGAYAESSVAGDLLFLSGTLPVVNGTLAISGRLGKNLSSKDGQEAARLAALNSLAIAQEHLGDLDRLKKLVKLTVLVATTESFTEHAAVADGASDLFIKIFGRDAGHVRLVYGVQSLPIAAPVIFDTIFQIEPASSPHAK